MFRLENQRYPGNLEELHLPEEEYFADNVLFNKYYTLEMKNTSDGNTFLATAIPKKGRVKSCSFCITEDGIIRFDLGGKDISSYDMCRNLPSTELHSGSEEEHPPHK